MPQVAPAWPIPVLPAAVINRPRAVPDMPRGRTASGAAPKIPALQWENGRAGSREDTAGARLVGLGLPILTILCPRSGRELTILLFNRAEPASAPSARKLALEVRDTDSGLSLSTLVLELVPDGGRMGLFITGLQFGSDPRTRGLIRDTTREMYGLRPKALAFWSVQQLAAIWNISRIGAAGGGARALLSGLTAGPDQFWRECDGRSLADGNWELPLRMAVRSRAELKPNRRSMYESRYAMLKRLRPGLLAAALALAPAEAVFAPTDRARIGFAPRPHSGEPAGHRGGGFRSAAASTSAPATRDPDREEPVVSVLPSRTPPVLVINLDRSTARLARIQSQLAALGLPFHRLPAVDGNGLPNAGGEPAYSEELNRRLYHKPLVPGEIGCYLSHLRAWQWLLDHSCKSAVILEDDVTVGEDFVPALELLSRIAEPWDVIKLGSLSSKPVLHSTPLGPFALRRYRKTPISAFAQAVSRQGAEKLLRTRLPFGRPVDVDLQHVWENDLSVFGLEPYPVAVRTDEQSEICRSFQRNRVRCNRLTFFRQRLQFTARQWRHNLGWYGWRMHDLLSPRRTTTDQPGLTNLHYHPK